MLPVKAAEIAVNRPAAVLAAANRTLKIRLFGAFSASLGGDALPKMRTRKELWLLALLILHGADRPVERSWIAGTLWPESLESAALFNLRRSLTFLRNVLGPEAERIVSPTSRSLRINMDGVDCDVIAFDNAVKRGTEESHIDAVALYCGPLLLGCSEDWVFEQRNSRLRDVLGALESLAASTAERGDTAGAISYLERVLDLDPFRETSLRALMETLASQGQNAAATRYYRDFRLRVRQDMNAEPDAETVALFRRIQNSARGGPGSAAGRGNKTLPDATPRAFPTNLPAAIAKLVGRDTEIESITAAMRGCRLLTLTGAGGVGKTRLSLAVGDELRDEFPDGVWFVELAPLREPGLTASVVLACFGLREQPRRSAAEVVEAFVADKKLLVILDNCEHIVAACSQFVQTLLRRCRNLHILATSRELLHAHAEWVWPVHGLPPTEAQRLFQQRASEASFGFQVTEANAEAITVICRLLDGVPLAIEMAAARTRGMAVVQIAANMAHVFRLLGQPDRNLDDRHQTLQATLEWSYDLLNDPERRLLEAVSVFQGGWSLECAEDLCFRLDSLDKVDILDILASLVDKSLIVFTEDQSGAGRYRLLETVRQFGEQKLRLANSEAALRQRHGLVFQKLADASELPIQGPDQDQWTQIMKKESDNFRAALGWYECEATAGSNGLAGVRLTRALLRFWLMSGRVTEIRDWARRALAYSEGRLSDNDRIWRTKLLADSGVLAFVQGDYTEARQLAEQSIEIYRTDNNLVGIALATTTLGNIAERQSDYHRALECHTYLLDYWRAEDNPIEIAAALNNLSTPTFMLGDFDGAHGMLSEALLCNRRIGNPQTIAITLHNLGILSQIQGKYADARVFHEEALAIRRAREDPNGLATSLGSLGEVLGALGDLASWKSMSLESIALRRKTGDRLGIALGTRDLGMIALQEGDTNAARAYFRESLILRVELSEQRGIALCLMSIAILALTESPESSEAAVFAATLCGTVDSIFATLGSGALSTRQHSERKALTDVLARSLSDTDYSAAHQVGRTMPRSEVLELALRA